MTEHSDYPKTAIRDVESVAVDRFQGKISVYGDGRNWLDDDPEYHAWRVVANVVDATEGEDVDMEDLGDALNHIAFIADITSENNE